MGNVEVDSFESIVTEIKHEIRHSLWLILNKTNEFSYAYFVMNKTDGSCPWIISDYPQTWLEQYLHLGYQRIDPVMLSAYRRISPFYWQGDDLSVPQHHFFRMSKNYSLDCGCTFTLHDADNNIATLSISNRGSKSDFYQHIEQEKEKFQMLLINIHEKIMTYSRSISSADLKCHAGHCHISLSPREKEVLFWASAGKTYGEIATILGIREGTVKFHIRNIIDKMGVSNAKHAISRATEMKLFS
ncbi:helix-turn-helix transcriptional regulator [Biostraticola tofi]|uniref:LuxR family quorum-sensing system transcriptional regulator ExpR n=1 Tax=Biostraticola tofi TaxID=466109 RepID=A0A4R3YM65_9GAMM|nr:LuxR family transcriptional regulator [Biostraticola tofi]TCV91913.1 LuxR family quorum-sensing system transcriptional regulator ExpR [Biostraticola tofi]